MPSRIQFFKTFYSALQSVHKSHTHHWKKLDMTCIIALSSFVVSHHRKLASRNFNYFECVHVGMPAYACNPSYLKAKARGFQVIK